MKKIISIILIVGLFGIIFYGIVKDIKKVQEKTNIDYSSVTYNGWLKTQGNKLLNSNNEEIQLRGISTHGIQWYKDIYIYDNIKNLKNNWGINVFRIAMYTDPEKDGYIKNKDLKEDVIELVDYAIELDIYVIIDWHILSDSDPNKYKEESLEFFDEMSKKYKDVPNVIFEICNEPNNETSWNDIKDYAYDVIEVIRQNSPKSLIIVGTPDFSKGIYKASKAPLVEDNIIYAVHFYAGSDDKILKLDIDDALNKNLPIFVSECGITDASGDGDIHEKEFREWIEFLDDRNISWVFWSFSNKEESSSLLLEDYKPVETKIYYEKYGIRLKIGEDFNNYLSETGKIVKDIFNSYLEE